MCDGGMCDGGMCDGGMCDGGMCEYLYNAHKKAAFRRLGLGFIF